MRRGTPLGLLLLAGLLTAGQQTQAQQTQSRTRAQPQTFTVKATPKTVVWGYYDAAAPPVLRVASGKEVTNKGPGGHILNGPVFVEGAEPGDALEVRIQQIRLAIPYAYNGFSPGRGFLPEDFPYARMRIIPLDAQRMVATFAPTVEIPLRPFLGSMGVAPPETSGRISSGPPWVHGGNMDNKELVAGTTLFLPVHVRGALFFVGDGHAGQGNGEVETPSHYISMGFTRTSTRLPKWRSAR